MDEAAGMLKISLVDYPAVETDFQTFAAQTPLQKFAVEDEEKRLVFGVVMRANFPIYRYTKERGGYYMVFDRETIRTMAEKYLADGNCNNVNLQHEDGSDVEGVKMTQYFIKDTAAGLAPAAFPDIEDGSLFAEFHIENDDVWQGVKGGDFKGFSLEGMFELVPETSTEKMSADLMTEAVAELDAIPNKSNKQMTLIERMKAALAKFVEEAGEPAEKFGRVASDKGVLVWEGDDPLAVGNAVWSEDKDGNRVELEDGDYKTEEKVVSVAGGEVTEIKDAEEPEPAPAEPTAEQKAAKMKADIKEKFTAIRQAFSYSLDTLYSALYAAIDAARGNADYYICDMLNDAAIIEDWNGKCYKYGYTADENGAVTLAEGEPEEVKRVWVSASEPAKQEGEEMAAMKAENENFRAENDNLKTKLAEVETKLSEAEAKLAKPAGKTAHEQFKTDPKPAGENPIIAARKYLK